MEDAEVRTLLEKTSRTFALAIPLLPPPLAREVGIAYLLFRIADTLEDADLWHRDARIAALHDFERWLDGGGDLRIDPPPTKNAGYMNLLARAGAVRAAASDVAKKHVKRTAHGMAEFVARQDDEGRIVLTDLADLRAYCYFVAGIVGEMLTELFGAAPALSEDGKLFGEGLQLVNILKDAPADAREGRVYLPPSVPRAEIMQLARDDLRVAERYVAALRADAKTIAFCTLPLRLATATLDRLEAGAPKLSRDEAMAIFADVTSSLR